VPVLPPGCGEAGRCYLAYPNLANPRWLLPQNPRFSHLYADLYTPQRPLGWLFKRLMQIGVIAPRIWLEKKSIAELEEYLAAALAVQAVEIAISLGTPGRYRKTTLQIMAPTGKIVAYAKMAKPGAALDSLETELANLKLLCQVPELRPHVAQPIGWGEWGGAKILLLSPGPRRAGPYRLGADHLRFLTSLHHAFARDVRFVDGEVWARLVLALTEVVPELSSSWQTRCNSALKRLEAELRATRVPHSFAHGDFAPWNIRAGTDGLFVFDWEAGRRSAFPFHDAFHFTAAQAMVANRPNRLNTRFLANLAESTWRKGKMHIPWAYLVYLMETSIYHAEARVRAPSVGDDKFVTWLADELDRYLATLT
jgi:Phosphotransferase enzyme family